MPNKCRTKHVQIRTNAEQKSLKLVACRAHDEQRSYQCPQNSQRNS